MNHNNAIGPTDKYRRGAHIAGFWHRNNVSPCADLLVSMCRRKNWEKQVLTRVLELTPAHARELVFCLAAMPTTDTRRNGLADRAGSNLLVLGRSGARCWLASPVRSRVECGRLRRRRVAADLGL